MNGITNTGVFITGGCGDIGQAVARRFLAAGARVVLADMLPMAQGRALARKLDARNTAYTHCDVTRSSSVDRAFATAIKFLGRLDTVICNAGAVENQPFVEVTEAAWKRVLEVNLTGSFLTAQRGARLLLKNPRRGRARRGTILFTGSWVQDMPWPQGAGYCASKGGQQMLAKIIAQELAPHGINAAIVAPGMVYAGLTKRICDRDKRFARQASRVAPLLRMSTAEEVAGSFLFLASEDGAYITGSTLLVDGGATLVRRD
ncbi:MAG: SDR family oxidoreductase [Opitutaceae bacterium]|nr:SDR family oxidoreductase [Opitutaceae bacterium]